MKNTFITTHKSQPLKDFLESRDFVVEDLENDVLKITRENELPVFLTLNECVLYFEVDLGNMSEFASQDFYFELLDMNTEILPVSFGINNTNPEDPRLVLVESRETGDLNEHEILSVFDALELATDKAEELLTKYVK